MTYSNSQDNNKFVILGFPRSGTTLLSRLLSTHQDISCPPETNILGACGRFLREENTVEGPPIGVLSALEFIGIDQDEILDRLREMFFFTHEKAANGKSIWVEKSGFDVFHIDQIETLLAGHCKFISIVRHPFDVAASVKDLTDTMGIVPPELQKYTNQIPSHFEAYGQAWADCNERIIKFGEQHPDDFIQIRYEDLVSSPLDTINLLAMFMSATPFTEQTLSTAFEADNHIGLGDWRIYETTQVDGSRTDRWKKSIGPSAANRLLPRVQNLIEKFGYNTPELPKIPRRADAVKRYSLAKKMQISKSIASREQ